MKFCTNCGKELLDEAVVCPGCGCAAGEGSAAAASGGTVKNKKRVKLAVLIPIASVVLVLAVLAAIILPHRNFDLEMKDFKNVGTVGALFRYGFYDDIHGMLYEPHPRLVYDDGVTFYDIPVESFTYCPIDGQKIYPMVELRFNERYAGDVIETLIRYCGDIQYGGLFDYRDLNGRCSVSGDQLVVSIYNTK